MGCGVAESLFCPINTGLLRDFVELAQQLHIRKHEPNPTDRKEHATDQRVELLPLLEESLP